MINMTNVEYIDYFEKIIANEPENILSLYFVQKLMSDVRFRSFQPMISAELQKKILKMVLPKLKNQFKINRLVDFNPIGVADEEIEILNKESVTDHSSYYAERFRDDVDKRLVGVYIDITGNKEIYKRPEMVHLLKDCKKGAVNLIFSQTRAYLAANTCDFCFLLKYLFDIPM